MGSARASNTRGCSRTSGRSGRRRPRNRSSATSAIGTTPGGSSMLDRAKLPRPEPSAGMQAYIHERHERLALDRRCFENWKRYLRAERGEAAVDYLPIKLDVENVSRCNFACTMCVVASWPKGKRADDMSVAQFLDLLDEQYGLLEIKLNGLGEALLAGEQFFSMIRAARSRRIWVRVTTNGSLLHLRENYRKLIASGVNEIDISIDGADAATFEKIRVGLNFERVKLGVRMLNDHCRSLGIVRTKMWTLVQKLNVRDLARHVSLAAELGFRHLVFSLQLHGWGHDELAERNAGEQVAVDDEMLWGLVGLGELRGIRVSFWDVSEKFEARPGKRCPWPFERAVVTSDLRTVPCCMIGEPDAFEIGKGKPFLENWRGDEYRAFRQAHLDGNIPSICKACYR